MVKQTADREHVAWDIETTGFAWDSEISVAGSWYPAGHADLLLNAPEGAVDTAALEEHLEACSGGVPVTVAATDDEEALLQQMHWCIFDRFDRPRNQLIGFNGEVSKGGFDLSFVRTRCIQHGVEWVFDGLQYADVWDVLKKRLNTTHVAHSGSTDINSLTGAHGLLFGDGMVAEPLQETAGEMHPWYDEYRYDPFEDSGSAAAHYQEGRYKPVLELNLADIHRTWELGEVIREYAAGKDISTKKL
jgi:hypothetical protein